MLGLLLVFRVAAVLGEVGLQLEFLEDHVGEDGLVVRVEVQVGHRPRLLALAADFDRLRAVNSAVPFAELLLDGFSVLKVLRSLNFKCIEDGHHDQVLLHKTRFTSRPL